MSLENKQYRQLIDKAAQLAYEYESKYFGCSQTALAALMETFGSGGPDLLRASTCLAGGVARRGHVCGSLRGGLMMIGFLTGRDDLAMLPQYQRAMDYGNKLYTKFRDEFGTVSCLEIQKMKFGKSFDLQNPEEREALHKKMAEIGDGCQAVSGAGARLAAEVICKILEQDL
ncbi:MAG: C_GCAxxG_C_C family protein, partial [Deltaproteobacteria bacterium]|nr:C_GCAxxG_C_C family protein [Deltaproteobacteria bacterium]